MSLTPPLPVTEYDMPADTYPWGITTGPDGNLWTANWPNNIARITPGGVVTRFPYPPSGDQTGTGCPTGITVGPDGNLWFTVRGCDKVGRITTDGTITLFDAPAIGPITAGGDGALWFPSFGAPYQGAIGRLTTSGTFTKFDTPGGGAMTKGSDGNVWYNVANVNNSGDKVARITPTGTVTQFAVHHKVMGMTLGPDGNVWFYGNLSVGRITPTGAIAEFDTRIVAGQPFAIAPGPDGNVWFMGQSGDTGDEVVGRVTLGGAVQLFTVKLTHNPSVSHNLVGLTAGPDGNMWLARSEGEVAKFAPPAG
jgi:streptogramin lyase